MRLTDETHSSALAAVKRGELPVSVLPETYEHACPNCGTCRDNYSNFWQRLYRVFFPRIPKEPTLWLS